MGYLIDGMRISDHDYGVLRDIASSLGTSFKLQTHLEKNLDTVVIKFKHIAEIGIYSKDCMTILPHIEKLEQLTQLVLHNCRIGSVGFTDSMVKLEILDLSYNKLTGVPTLFLPHLLSLDLRVNSISSIELPKSEKLKVVVLADNSIEAFPDLPRSVEFLNLRNNSIRELPDDLAKLFPRLRVLILDNNKISSLPDLPISLEFLSIARNSLSGDLDLRGSNLLRLEASANPLSDLKLPSSLKFLSCVTESLQLVDPKGQYPHIEKYRL